MANTTKLFAFVLCLVLVAGIASASLAQDRSSAAKASSLTAKKADTLRLANEVRAKKIQQINQAQQTSALSRDGKVEGKAESATALVPIADLPQTKPRQNPSERFCQADFNGNGVVDFKDIDQFKQILQCSWIIETGNAEGIMYAADINDDGAVNQADVNLFVSQLGKKGNDRMKGDLDFDNDVDFTDLSLFKKTLNCQMPTYQLADRGILTRADINADGKVDNKDVNLFVKALGTKCSTSTQAKN